MAIKAFKHLPILLISVLSLLSTSCLADGSSSNWMTGCWGVRVVIPAGNTKLVEDFNVNSLLDPLGEFKSLRWVMVNLTQGAYGGYFNAPLNSVNKINSSMAPKRDLFGETLKVLKKHNLKVLVYVAADGPAPERLTKHPQRSNSRKELKQNTSAIAADWLSYLQQTNKNYYGAYGDLIAEYAKLYKNEIDGWWFDHGRWSDADSILPKIIEVKPQFLIAWNQKHKTIKDKSLSSHKIWGMEKSNDYESFTAGHISPIKQLEPWSDSNSVVLDQFSLAKADSGKISGIQAHIFVPMQRSWRGGKPGFSDEKLFSWTVQAISSGGAITWAVALEPPEWKNSEIAHTQLAQLKTLDNQISKSKLCISNTAFP